MRGYVPQYDFAAAVIYDAIAAGRLRWIGLADRAARNFDDLVLGLHDRTVCHQLKSRSRPERFSVRTLLLGSTALLADLASVWSAFRNDLGGVVEVKFLTADYPHEEDSVGEPGAPSSAAFIRAVHANRSWSAGDWAGSHFAAFVDELRQSSGLSDDDFQSFFANITLGRAEDQIGYRASSIQDARRIKDIAALLPNLVADKSDKDRWTVDELLKQLDWRDPFSTKHGHSFPVDALVQENRKTQDQLQAALQDVSSGYIALVGPPGSGKSTLLQAGLLPTPRATVIRYLAFMPNEGHSLGRGEAFDFLHDLVVQLKRAGFGSSLVTSSTREELLSQFAELLREAGGKFKASGIRTIIVVDGLDHIPREEKTDRPLLRELPLPVSIPDGVVFILGTQTLELDDIPPTARDQAKAAERCIPISPLSKEAIFLMADLSGLPSDCDRGTIFDRSQGHPLSTRYVIEALSALHSPEERRAWLIDGPAYGGDVEAFYARAWHDLENDQKAKDVLSYVALAEGEVKPASLDRLVDPRSVDKAWRVAGHLLRRTKGGGWVIFHNSFRLFLLAQLNTRHGLPCTEASTLKYRKLAELAGSAGAEDEQRWMELRYSARAGDHAAVVKLAEPVRFRRQFIEGRSSRAIRDDIRLAFASVRSERSALRLVELILSRHEIEMRSEALGVDELIGAFIATSQTDKAIALLDTEDAHLSVGKAYDIVDALLEEGRFDEARQIFEKYEPLDKLLGTESVDGSTRDESLRDWAERAPIFRSPQDILASIDRLRGEERRFETFDIASYQKQLRFVVARWILERDPSQGANNVAGRYSVDPEWVPTLHFVVARAKHAEGNIDAACNEFEELAREATLLDEYARRNAAVLCCKMGKLDLARSFLVEVPAPTLNKDQAYYGDSFDRQCRAVFDHWTASAALDVADAPCPTGELGLVQRLEQFLAQLGRLAGLALAGKSQSIDTVMLVVRPVLTFLNHAQSKEDGHDSERYIINKALRFSASAITRAAAAQGAAVLTRTAEHIDEVLASQLGHLRATSFRRSFALATFRYQQDRLIALKRLVWQGSVGGERTPHEHIREVAEEAIGLAQLGERDRARQLLDTIHREGLGYSRAAKKDPQYVMWRDIFRRACQEDALAIPERVAAMVRLISGLSDTEGDNAGGRVTAEVLKWASYAGAATSGPTIDALEETGLTSWTEIVSSSVQGIAIRWPANALHAAIAFGRVALPFLDGVDSRAIPKLMQSAPTEQLEPIARHLSACIDTDGHEGARVVHLEQIVQGALLRGLSIELEAIGRWQSEDGPPENPGMGTDDAFANVKSITELSERLRTADGKSSWSIAGTVRRLAPIASHQELKALLDAHPNLLEEERILSIATLTAIREGASDVVADWAKRLAEKANEESSWGGYQSGAKTRLFTVRTQLEGDKAREEAFDRFAFDLSRGREWTYSLLPDIGEVLSLIKPTLPFAEVFRLLETHLEEFREYKSGKPLALPAGAGACAEQVLTELHVRAIDVGVSALTQQARLALRETAEVAGGASIAVRTIEALWSKGGNAALEAVRIAWDCRNVDGVRDALCGKLQSWASSRDIAVQRTVDMLAQHWAVEIEPVQHELPVFYGLELPHDAAAQHFDKPLGFRDDDEGMWSDDPNRWTWTLKFPLQTLSCASPFSIETLRRRTAQLMAQNGGKDAFGPSTTKRKMARMSRLGLRLTYNRPMAYAAMLAARQVAGELRMAGALNYREASFFIHDAGGFNPTTDTYPPQPRPPGCVKPHISTFFSGRHDEDKAASKGDDDTAVDRFPDWICLAAVTRYERTHFNEVLAVDRLAVPAISMDEAESLDDAYTSLNFALVAGIAHPIYRNTAKGAIVGFRGDAAGSFPEYGLGLCPVAAAHAGAKIDRRSPFIWLDKNGSVIARTIWWREGGFRADDTDDTLRGHGSMLLVRASFVKELDQVIGEQLRITAWRNLSHRRKGSKSASVAHRLHTISYSS